MPGCPGPSLAQDLQDLGSRGAGGNGLVGWLARVSKRFRVGGEVIGCRGFASQA